MNKVNVEELLSGITKDLALYLYSKYFKISVRLNL